MKGFTFNKGSQEPLDPLEPSVHNPTRNYQEKYSFENISTHPFCVNLSHSLMVNFPYMALNPTQNKIRVSTSPTIKRDHPKLRTHPASAAPRLLADQVIVGEETDGLTRLIGSTPLEKLYSAPPSSISLISDLFSVIINGHAQKFSLCQRLLPRRKRLSGGKATQLCSDSPPRPAMPRAPCSGSNASCARLSWLRHDGSCGRRRRKEHSW